MSLLCVNFGLKTDNLLSQGVPYHRNTLRTSVKSEEMKKTSSSIHLEQILELTVSCQPGQDDHDRLLSRLYAHKLLALLSLEQNVWL